VAQTIIHPPSIPNNTRVSNRGLFALLTFLLILLLLAFRLAYGSFILDDAFISFRYARNLAQGLGWVFNPADPPILGTTTPLFTLILSSLNWLGFSLEGASLWLSILSDGVSIGLLYLIGRQIHSPKLGLAAGLFIVLWPDYLAFSLSGLETSFYVALLLTSFYFYLGTKPLLTGMALAFLVLTRPDGLILVIVLAGYSWFMNRKIPWKMLVSFLPLPLLWFGFATLYFGSPISQSIMAKAGTADNPLVSLFYLTRFFLWDYKFIPTGLVLLGIWRILKEPHYSLLRLPLIWSGFYALIFVLAGAFRNFNWYYTPLLPFYFLGLLIGLRFFKEDLIATRLKNLPKPLNWLVKWLALGVGIGLLVLVTVVQYQKLVEAVNGREILYKTVVMEQLQKLPPDEEVAAWEIGAVGYYCNCRVYDLMGLVTPKPPNKVILETIKQIKPTYVFGFDVHLKTETLASAWFQANYVLLKSQSVRILDQRTFYLFKRID